MTFSPVAWLQDVLAEYAFSNPSENDAVSEFWKLLDHADDVTDPAHYLPGHITASAFALHPDGNSLLLIHHEKLDRWLQPGGHVEPGDQSLEDAARRELAEETGVVEVVCLGLLDLDVHVIPERGDIPRHAHYDVRFAFRCASTDIEALGGVHQSAWAPLTQLDRYDTDDSVRRAGAKLSRLIR